MNKFGNRFTLIVLLGSVLLMSACGFSLRQNIQPVDHSIGYRVIVESHQPAIGHAVSRALREAGYRISVDAADVEVRILKEQINYDELTPDTSGALEIRTIVYKLRFGAYDADDRAIIEPTTVELINTSAGETNNDQIEDTYFRKAQDDFRSQAARVIIELLSARAVESAKTAD